MSFLDYFKGKQYKEELERIKSTFTPEMQEANKLQELIITLNKNVEEIEKTIAQKNQQICNLDSQISNLNLSLSQKNSEIIQLDEEILLQSFGLYTPKYDFVNSDIYKDKLSDIRAKQKEAIKNGNASCGNMNWQVNGNSAKGKKMVKDMQKLLIRAFNSECDETISKVKFNNIESSEKRIFASKEAISKLGKIMNVAITDYYYNLKLQELYLAYEYAQKKQEEKEEQKRIREEIREQAKLEKEIEEQRKKITKEQTHYCNQLKIIISQLSEKDITPEKVKILEDKKSEIESQLVELDKSLKDVDYREANPKAGYVYVISNIGAFGENVYKIGMTRRLNPLDRVHELGDASVPFNFDVHAMIFSDNAPALEAELHKAFENKKLNMVNTRREFFHVTLEEIEEVVKANYDKAVEFTKLPPAEQYRQSLKMKQNK